MNLSQDQVKTCEDKGFVVVPGFFDKAVMDKVSALVDGLRDKEPAEGEDAKYFETSPISN